MNKIFTILLLLLGNVWVAQAQQPVISGRVLSADSKKPLYGALIKLKGLAKSATTDRDGDFTIHPADTNRVITVSYIGYQTWPCWVPNNGPVTIYLNEQTSEMKEIIVSNGYQQVSAEKTTGSFVQIDSALINRSVSTGILDRLDNVTSGLIFNTGKNAAVNDISIRGRSTLFGNSQPLIVLDNFPYDGDINNINPNDVESITVLKDAASASIWGARAGNGVIVITTKKGKYNHLMQVNFNSNVTVGDKPNIFYQPRMSSADFISVEEMLFAKGYYNSAYNSAFHKPLTPVVALLYQEMNGQVSAADANAQIAAYKNQDIRNDYEKYFFQKSVNQQYNLNLNGGSENQKYYLSAGYDNNRDNLTRNGYQRTTVNASNTYALLQHRLELTTGINFVQSLQELNNPGIDEIGLMAGNGALFYPYAQLADAKGNPLPMVHDYSSSFVQSAENAGLLDWNYRPLQDLDAADNQIKTIDYRINTQLKYKLLPELAVTAIYQYEYGTTVQTNLQDEDTYYTRDLINRFTQVNSDGTLTYNVPPGDILDEDYGAFTSQSFRTQLDYNKKLGGNSELTGLAGYEIKDLHTTDNSYRLYGYNDAQATNSSVDYVSSFPQYYFPGSTQQIPNNESEADLTDRYLSYFANGAYTYDQRYIVSGSARFDQSNLFGVKTNQKGVPLWSLGGSWIINRESFYNADWLPSLKARLTYGYNGNIDKSLSAYMTANYFPADESVLNSPAASIVNPPNPDLRWERDKVINLGLDFSTKNNRISGTLEYYVKNGYDLIGDIPYPTSTGISVFTGNTADTKGSGFDLTLNTKNIDGLFKWASTVLFSYAQDIASNYKVQAPNSTYASSGDQGLYPLQGKPLFALYSYKWAGLDPQNGNPRAYLNGQVSEDYAAIVNSSDINNLVYDGPTRPLYFGALRNTFSYHALSLSFNIAYRFDYYYRANGITYSAILKGQGYDYGSYSQRWQKPGDEATTQVPSLPTAINANRDAVYNFSTVLAKRADNARFQDLNLTYTLGNLKINNFQLHQFQVYLYANNLGILWKATKGNIDPDYPDADYAPVRTIAAGIKTNF